MKLYQIVFGSACFSLILIWFFAIIEYVIYSLKNNEIVKKTLYNIIFITSLFIIGFFTIFLCGFKY